MPIGLGGAPLGNLLTPVSDAAASETLLEAWNSGIRLFDTAPLYGSGLSEHRIGAALRHRPRDQFMLSTKVGRLLAADPAAPVERNGYVGGLPFRVDFDYSAAGARRSLEDSYQRLGLARIDIALIHDPAEDTHGGAWGKKFGEAMAGAAVALSELRRAGVIRHWGLGVNRVEPCLLALEQADPDIFLLAGRYTLLDHAALDTLFPACAARGARVVIGGPYNSGLLAGGDTYDYAPAPPALREKVAALRAICARWKIDLKAAALQFCAAHPVVAWVIPGARNAAEVSENSRLMGETLPGEFWAALKASGLIPPHAPTPAG